MDTSIQKRLKRGVVVSRSGDKSIRVQINYLVKHPMYGKYIRRRTKLGVHDPKNVANIGDTVDIAQCKPISKSKSWRLVSVVEKGIVE
ncbi:30S ribosomal protein S17 [Anaerohalosphaera lusitana]|uniref:Small ribosomal subunit protein uS17 n=1 Tax=Anaerohalosphaera lusitana TaxID=1936003 RepID=A0A1U9NQ38_9BACT|nr:30S ribosomal protein S17 [Anaerohalosphaera lusitana]AQT69844.1 30S ribosomal protein S17 [Anaerohalosphaera lusitana]